MAMPAEDIMILMDNSDFIRAHPECITAQCLAIELYCKTKFKCNPQNRVGLFKTGSHRFGITLYPTSDFKRVEAFIGGFHFYDYCDGWSIFALALKRAVGYLERYKRSRNTKKRILGFVGSASPLDLYDANLVELGNMLKEKDISLDVVTLYPSRSTWLGRVPNELLAEIVRVVNDSVEKRMPVVNVAADAEASLVWESLSNSILEMDIFNLSEKNLEKEEENVKQEEMGNEKNIKSDAAEGFLPEIDLEPEELASVKYHAEEARFHVDESSFLRLLFKSISEIKKKKENVNNNNVKQEELEPSCSAKIEQSCCRKVTRPVIDLKPGENEKVKLEAA